MADEPDNLILVYLRRIDGKVDRLAEDIGDLRNRVTSLDEQVVRIRGDLVAMSFRIDGVRARLDRIERRLDLVGSETR